MVVDGCTTTTLHFRGVACSKPWYYHGTCPHKSSISTACFQSASWDSERWGLSYQPTAEHNRGVSDKPPLHASTQSLHSNVHSPARRSGSVSPGYPVEWNLKQLILCGWPLLDEEGKGRSTCEEAFPERSDHFLCEDFYNGKIRVSRFRPKIKRKFTALWY